VQFQQLLSRQRWAKIGIPLPDQADHCLAQRRTVGAIAGPAALARHQALGALALKRTLETKELTPSNPQQRRGSVDAQAAIAQFHQNLETVQFLLTHSDHRHVWSLHPAHGRMSAMTSLSVRRATSQSVTYTQAVPALPVGADPQIADESVRHRVLQACSTVVEHAWRQGNKCPSGRAAGSGLLLAWVPVPATV